ncbi:hypothetical protein Aperf_G00000088536 [Anoplocephala perfoliata]
MAFKDFQLELIGFSQSLWQTCMKIHIRVNVCTSIIERVLETYTMNCLCCRHESSKRSSDVQHNSPKPVVSQPKFNDQAKEKPFERPLFDEHKYVTVCALYDFYPTEKNELKFNRDDILKITGRFDEPWRMAKNMRTREEGLIPHNYITENTAIAGALAAWYPANRVEAELRLLAPGTEPGTFMIRPSQEPNIYALSLRTMKNGLVRIHHFKISHSTDDSSFYIDKNNAFPSMNKLIDFYRDHPVKDNCKLMHPCAHEKPQAPFQQAELNRSLVKLNSLIDRGNFGEVWLGQIQSVKVAVKKPLHPAAREDFLREAKKMHAIWHPQLVQFLGVCTKPESEPILIITEYMEKGSLSKYLPSEEGRKLVVPELLLIMDQVASGMCYLESIGLVHRDLRAANVFIGNNLRIKVGDFGQSKMMSMPSGTPLDIRTPTRWSSPEALVNEDKVTSRSDVWQYGILGYEVFTYGGRPYDKYQSSDDVIKAIRAGEVLKRPVECPEPFYKVMLSCWELSPSRRPKFAYLKNYLEESLEKIDSGYFPNWANEPY